MSKQVDNKYNEAMVQEFGREAAPGKRLVRNLMSQKVIEIEDDTPLCCNPASETYWCM